MNPLALIPFILTFVVANFPKIWDVIKSTSEAVAVQFNGSTNDEKKALVVKNLSSWYRLVDNANDGDRFNDDQDKFFLETFLPDAVDWVYQLNKIDFKALVKKLLGGKDVIEYADQDEAHAALADKIRLEDGNYAQHIDPALPDVPVVLTVDGKRPAVDLETGKILGQAINWGPDGPPANLPKLDPNATGMAYGYADGSYVDGSVAAPEVDPETLKGAL